MQRYVVDDDDELDRSKVAAELQLLEMVGIAIIASAAMTNFIFLVICISDIFKVSLAFMNLINSVIFIYWLHLPSLLLAAGLNEKFNGYRTRCTPF